MQYEENGKVLKYCSDSSPNIVISSSCEIIFGSNADNYCFRQVRNSLESVQFNADSNLIEIGPHSFRGCIKLQEIDLKNCSKLTIIGIYAFWGCSVLSNVILPSNLKSLKGSCFGATAIQSIRIPASLQEIESAALAYNPKLKSVTFEDDCSLSGLPVNLFLDSNLTSFVFPRNISWFFGLAFQNNYYIESIDIDPLNKNFVVDSNKVIYNPSKTSLYYFASGIKGSFTVPSTVTAIMYGSFCASQLTTLIIEDSVTSIGLYVFLKSKISQISLPDSILTIEASSFYGMKSLETISLPNKLKRINSEQFRYSGLKNITIPESVTTIDQYAFADCPDLQKIYLHENIKNIGGGVIFNSPNATFDFGKNSNLYIIDDLLMDRDNTFISQYFGSNNTVTIPSTVRRIRANAFSGISSIINVKCDGESELEYIENNAFYNCINLQQFFNFARIRSIGDNAFRNTKLNQKIVFGENLTNIGIYAFLYSHISSVEFLSQFALKISLNAFGSCVFLNSIVFRTSSNVTLDDFVFAETKILKSINFPTEIISVGINCFKNSGLSSVTFQSNTFTPSNIPDLMFLGCTFLTEFEFPTNIVSIGANSFQGTNLSIITLPDSLKILGYQCFKDCKLSELHISDESNLETIDSGAFENCFYFNRISEFSSKNFVGNYNALYNKDKSRIFISPPASPTNFFSLPNTVKIISDNAFMGCVHLRSITIPDNSVTSIGRNAFSGCSSLQTINFPLCVVNIGENAFFGCSKLSCGVIIQNKTIQFRHLLVNARLPSRALNNCDFKTCALKVQQYNYALIYAMILL